jgi:hypothetical protein
VVKKLKAIVFKTVPRISNDGCRPYFEISHGIDHKLLLTNRHDQFLPSYYAYKDDAMIFQFSDYEEPILYGDVHFSFKNKGSISDALFCRIAFNTSFIGPSNTLVAKKTTISPDSSSKDVRISDDFMV